MILGFRPLLVFFLLAYLISLAIWLPLYLPTFGIKSMGVLPFQHGMLITIWGIVTIFWFKPTNLSNNLRVKMPLLRSCPPSLGRGESFGR